MEEVFYCGFNGFRQVPYQPDKQTITTLVSQCGKVQHSEKSNKVNYYLGFYRKMLNLKYIDSSKNLTIVFVLGVYQGCCDMLELLSCSGL